MGTDTVASLISLFFIYNKVPLMMVSVIHVKMFPWATISDKTSCNIVTFSSYSRLRLILTNTDWNFLKHWNIM